MTTNVNLSDFSDEELKEELTQRGYTVLDPITPIELQAPEFEAVSWTEIPKFEIPNTE